MILRSASYNIFLGLSKEKKKGTSKNQEASIVLSTKLRVQLLQSKDCACSRKKKQQRTGYNRTAIVIIGEEKKFNQGRT